MRLIWNRLAKKLNGFPYKETTMILVAAINIEDMVNHNWNGLKNIPQKCKFKKKNKTKMLN